MKIFSTNAPIFITNAHKKAAPQLGCGAELTRNARCAYRTMLAMRNVAATVRMA